MKSEIADTVRKFDPKKCVVCGEKLEQDYKEVPSISANEARTVVLIGSHCPNCGLKYAQNVSRLD